VGRPLIAVARRLDSRAARLFFDPKATPPLLRKKERFLRTENSSCPRLRVMMSSEAKGQ
jgi:hypothetical protein